MDTSCLICDQYCSGKQGYSQDDVELLNPNKKNLRYAPGEVLIKQGTFMDHIFFLRKGLIKVVIESDHSKNIILEIISQERFLGMSSLHISCACPVSFIALTECEVCQIRKQYVQQIVLANATFNRKIFESCGEECHYLYNRIGVYGSRNNHGRLASSLLYLDSKQFRDSNIYSVISRKELAELSAMSIESMNKILKEFKEDLIVSIEEKQIRILRSDLLERISRIG